MLLRDALAALAVACPGGLPFVSVAEAKVEQHDCRCLEIQEDGALLLEWRGEHHVRRLVGVTAASPMPSAWRTLVLERLAKLAKPQRCEPLPSEDGGKVRVYYLAWVDKSGEVWEDLGATLVDLGFVTVAEASFPERTDYLAREQKARAQGRGVWKR